MKLAVVSTFAVLLFIVIGCGNNGGGERESTQCLTTVTLVSLKVIKSNEIARFDQPNGEFIIKSIVDGTTKKIPDSGDHAMGEGDTWDIGIDISISTAGDKSPKDITIETFVTEDDSPMRSQSGSSKLRVVDMPCPDDDTVSSIINVGQIDTGIFLTFWEVEAKYKIVRVSGF